MAVNLDILAVGYAVESNTDQPSRNKFMKATCSCCLVYSNQMLILFDTMGPWERSKLIECLAARKVHPDDIEYLVCSHSHPDHIGNLNLFTKAKKHFVGSSVYTNDCYDLNCFEPTGSYKFKSLRSESLDVITYEDFKLDSFVVIEKTEGHTMECISLIVENCDSLGTVALAGDLFENGDDVTDESIWLRAGSQNPDLQRANRERIYNKADAIMPGHGPLFKTDRPIKF